ncbi:hypothetical protein F5Y05DRAFT_370024 [Hypoxylon sp. FL0543]|nr:hypothetical protein F5Y05DRAFT_370024 [Hypoxylon sp. FL0543]
MSAPAPAPKPKVCTWELVKYACGCISDLGFKQCEAHSDGHGGGSCKEIRRQIVEYRGHVCADHLPKRRAKKRYLSQGGAYFDDDAEV